MKFLSWNIRGLNNPQKQYSLKQIISQEKIDCVLIQETKMSCTNFDKIAGYIWPGAGYLHRDFDGALGGIATMWSQNSMVGYEITKEKNFIITHFQSNCHYWKLINIYAPNSIFGRKEMYDNLVRIIETMLDEQWMCMGDFNLPLFTIQKRGEATENARRACKT